MSEYTDQELLKMAAKAAGYDFDGNIVRDRYSSNVWNPLDSDGDALRLAVELSMRVYVYNGGGDDFTVVANDELTNPTEHIKEPHNGDGLAATRRAIVRAAAALATVKTQSKVFEDGL